MHLQPVFAHLPAYINGTSERLFRTGLSLPSGSALSDDQFERVADAITRLRAARSPDVWHRRRPASCHRIPLEAVPTRSGSLLTAAPTTPGGSTRRRAGSA